MYVFVCVVPLEAKKGQWVLVALELESWMVVNYHVDAGNELESSKRAARALSQQVISPAPVHIF